MAGSAALNAYRSYGSALALSDEDRYALLEAMWMGTWRNDPRIRQWRGGQPALYRNTVQLWRQLSAVVNLYAQFVYIGDLSTNGQLLPDGSRGAIPIDPQTGDDAADEQMLVAFGQLFTIWQYRQYMSLRPKTCAILGDCLTELVDDYPRGIVLPNTIDPRYIMDLELDHVGNVKAYAVEYHVSIPESTAFGMVQKADAYTFRKEVTSDGFWFYRDDKPYDYTTDTPNGSGAFQDNPYGFCPAIWDRHEIVVGRDRGISATEKTLTQTMHLNSVLSHAMDFQQKKFAAPIGYTGGSALPRNQTLTMTMPGGITNANATADELESSRRIAAENINLFPMQKDSEFLSIDFDIGQTREMLGLVMDSIMAENPEARYGQEILQMTQITGPGMERALSPIVGLVKAARANADPQTIKLLQMGTAIMGFRVNSGDIPAELMTARRARYEAFRPYGLDSFGQGLFDCSIPDRPVLSETKDEKVARLVMIESLTSEWALAEAGVPEEEIARITGEREKQRAEMASAFSVTGANMANDEPPDGDQPDQPDVRE